MENLLSTLHTLFDKKVVLIICFYQIFTRKAMFSRINYFIEKYPSTVVDCVPAGIIKNFKHA